MKKVILTGATGFVGSAVTRKLLDENVQVVSVVRSKSKAKQLFPQHPLLQIVVCDMQDIACLSTLILDRDIDTCYHFAWTGVSGTEFIDCSVQMTNVINTVNLITEISKMKVCRFIGAGSIHELECLHTMQSENQRVPLANIYKASKLYAHHIGRTLCSQLGLDFLWPIITNTYGAGERSSRLVVSTINKLLCEETPSFSDGTQTYNFTYITDVANAFFLIGKLGTPSRHYIISNDDIRPLKAYLEELGQCVAPNVPLQFSAMEQNYNAVHLPAEFFDCNVLKQDVGMNFEVSFAEGIAKTVSWLRFAAVKGE